MTWPWIASQPPSKSTPTSPSDGIAVSAGLYLAVNRSIRSRDPYRSSLAASIRSISCSSWPNPLTTRTPPIASSTIPATSPTCCCACQLAGNSFLRAAVEISQSAGRDRDRHQREQRRQRDHDDQREDEQHEAAQGQRHPLDQALHHVEVGDRPADELAGVDLVLPGAVQPGQRVEQLGPHGVLHVERHLAAAVPPHVDADEVGRRGDEQPDRQRPDRLLGRDDDVVDDRPAAAAESSASPRHKAPTPPAR